MILNQTVFIHVMLVAVCTAQVLLSAALFGISFKALKERYSEDEAIEILRRYAFQMIFTTERYTDVYDALLVIE